MPCPLRSSGGCRLLRAAYSSAAPREKALSGTLLSNAVIAQPASQGALPSLYAVTAPEVHGGDYISPDGFLSMRG